VHVGQEDGSYEDARLAVGADAIVGVTCHDSRHLAMEAGEAGADYVAFGAFFPTTTKDAKGKPELDILEWWSGVFTLPCVAIGGITPDNCAPLVKAGADFLAVLSAVWQHPDGPAAAVKLFNAKIAEAKAALA
jgi:thiamine-phosphate pyrophosphorylase